MTFLPTIHAALQTANYLLPFFHANCCFTLSYPHSFSKAFVLSHLTRALIENKKKSHNKFFHNMKLNRVTHANDDDQTTCTHVRTRDEF